MRTKETILETIKDHQEQIARFGVKNIGLYGSYARNEQTLESDIDLLIDFKPEYEKFDNYMALCDYLERLFTDERIEIITKSGLSPYIGPKILEEVVYA
ncbi:nucleotidyltransferase family protein [Tunicatimonas pelagia]|uniref:nucleotidyltransferase family protein n=1 Tax=Tunicatimonas pelagia TaxID=931531 RepID=UPI002666E131|nr:nucleotidyltransferase family protein [Tunicatimonas pelagia]WKN45757.1 nucleotidyltransferase family protein [Tunicatimonas pelagia]